MEIDIGAYTDAGKVREINQDRALATSRLFAVADGMGGHVGGEVAAELALEELLKSFKTDPTGKGLAAAIRGANLAVWTKGMDDPSLRGMGTTLTAGTLTESSDQLTLYLSHVGDSRAYILREGELSQLTEDHTVVEELVRQGKLTETQAQVDKRRHTLTRALGVEPNILVDSFKVNLESGDIILLCSDGLSNELSENEIVTLLASDHIAQQKAEDLVRLAKAHGGKDNITTVIIKIKDAASSLDVKSESLADDILPVTAGADEQIDSSLGTFGDSYQSDAASSAELNTTSAQFLTQDSTDEATLLDFPAFNENMATITDNESLPLIPVGEPEESVVLKTKSKQVKIKLKGTLIYDLSDEYDESDQIDTRVPFLTFRTIVFIALMVAVSLSVYGAIRWFADNSYYVGLSGNNIAVYHGRPGGQYFFKPKLVSTTNLTKYDVLPNQATALQKGVEVSSLNGAYQLINDLKAQEKKMGLGQNTTTTTIPFTQLLTQTT